MEVFVCRKEGIGRQILDYYRPPSFDLFFVLAQPRTKVPIHVNYNPRYLKSQVNQIVSHPEK